MYFKLKALSWYRMLMRSLRPNSGLTKLSFNPIANYLFSGIPSYQIAELDCGARVPVDVNEYHGRILWLFGTNDVKVARTVNGLLARDMDFLDIGANYGSIGFAALNPSNDSTKRHIHFFEPQPKLAESIRSVIQSLKIKNALLHQVALYDSNGKMNLSLAPLHSGVASLVKKHGYKSIEVQVRDTYEYLEPIIGSKRFGVKIDIEGAETKVIPGLIKMPGMAFIVFEGDLNQGELFDIFTRNRWHIFGLCKTLLKPRYSPVRNLAEWHRYHDFVALPSHAPRPEGILSLHQLGTLSRQGKTPPSGQTTVM